MSEQRDIIIQKTVELFNQVGIRSCSIDDICRELGISKKTFYQYFATKDELVEAMLRRHEEHIIQCSRAREMEHPSAMHFLMHFLEQTEKMKDVRRVPVLLFDLKKYYPQLMERHISALARINKENIFRLLQRGIEEGDFRKDLNPELGSVVLSELDQLTLNNITHLAQYEQFADLSIFALDMIIRGIVSEQGLAKMEQMKIKEDK